MLHHDSATNFHKIFGISKAIKKEYKLPLYIYRYMRLPLRLYYVHYNQCLPWFICYILGVKWVQNICEVILYVFIECRNILHWIYKGKLMVWYLGLITMHVCKICQKCRSNVLKSIRKSKIHIFISIDLPFLPKFVIILRYV